MNKIPIHVECYAGYRAEETPRSIAFKTRKIRVKRVIDRWLDPDHRYFKVLGENDGVYIVRHDPRSGNWELTYYSTSTSSL